MLVAGFRRQLFRASIAGREIEFAYFSEPRDQDPSPYYKLAPRFRRVTLGANERRVVARENLALRASRRPAASDVSCAFDGCSFGGCVAGANAATVSICDLLPVCCACSQYCWRSPRTNSAFPNGWRLPRSTSSSVGARSIPDCWRTWQRSCGIKPSGSNLSRNVSSMRSLPHP